jgi:hypothetical protein
MNLVEVSRLPWSIFVFPTVCLWVREAFFYVEQFFFLVHILLCLGSEHGFGSDVRIDRSLHLL